MPLLVEDEFSPIPKKHLEDFNISINPAMLLLKSSCPIPGKNPDLTVRGAMWFIDTRTLPLTLLTPYFEERYFTWAPGKPCPPLHPQGDTV